MKNLREVNLITLGDIETEKQLKLRKIRNSPDVRKWMHTSHLISLDEHLAWIKSLDNNKSKITFGIIELDEIIGAFNIYNINSVHKICEWGYFLDSEKSGIGLGSAIEFYLIDFIFNNLGMFKQSLEVLEENISVINMHKKFFLKKKDLGLLIS